MSPLLKSSVVGLGVQTRGSRGSGLSPTTRSALCPTPVLVLLPKDP